MRYADNERADAIPAPALSLFGDDSGIARPILGAEASSQRQPATGQSSLSP